jgi:hypothetical protein
VHSLIAFVPTFLIFPLHLFIERKLFAWQAWKRGLNHVFFGL